MWTFEGPKMSKEEAQEVTRRDLEEHPELTPLLDVDKDGNVTCFGWKSPVYSWPEE